MTQRKHSEREQRRFFDRATEAFAPELAPNFADPSAQPLSRSGIYNYPKPEAQPAPPKTYIAAEEKFGLACEHCEQFHPKGALFRCESCCRLVCERLIFTVEETGFRVHVLSPEAEDLEDAACGLANVFEAEPARAAL
jgi:hypothetical protein